MAAMSVSRPARRLRGVSAGQLVLYGVLGLLAVVIVLPIALALTITPSMRPSSVELTDPVREALMPFAATTRAD